MSRPVYIATRGSALALAQSNLVRAQCEKNFPHENFELKVIKTTGDKQQTINLTNANQSVTKGLFTKELEVALLNGEADFAVHSLKDLPTDLPEGLYLSSVCEREDVRDALIYRSPDHGAKRGFPAGTQLRDLPSGATIGSSSTRRQAQILAARPDLKTAPIRGNVGTRLQKLRDQAELDGTILALAGLKRLGLSLSTAGVLSGAGVPDGLFTSILPLNEMLPCVGQAALGIESRIGDPRIDEICAALNHLATFLCVTAERAFLREMGGGCLSPVAAHAEIKGENLHLRAVSFRSEMVRRTERTGPQQKASEIGAAVARELI